MIKFTQVCDITEGKFRRISGFAKAHHLLALIDNFDATQDGFDPLSANPRFARVNPIVKAIQSSIENDPDTFPFMTKGILLSSSNIPENKDKEKRYSLNFDLERRHEGVLDGGHNLLAVALFMLQEYLPELDAKIINGIKTWHDLKNEWPKYKASITKSIDAKRERDDNKSSFLVPIEIIVPAEQKYQEDFRDKIHEISRARNNNVQLTQSSTAYQKGHYLSIEQMIKEKDENLAGRIAWKAGDEPDKRPISPRDVISLAWIPLSLLDGKAKVTAPPANQLYNGKGKSLDSFIKLMESDEVAKLKDGQYELQNPKIASAFKILPDIIKLYDIIWKEFPNAYNKSGGKFGRITSVKEIRGARGVTPFKYYDDAKYSCPDGFIMPLIYAISALMKLNNNDELEWDTDPFVFVEKYLGQIVVENYSGFIRDNDWDPKRIGRANSSYDFMKTAFSVVKNNLKK